MIVFKNNKSTGKDIPRDVLQRSESQQHTLSLKKVMLALLTSTVEGPQVFPTVLQIFSSPHVLKFVN